MSSFWSKRARALRRHLIAGVVVLTPVAATAFVLLWVFRMLDGVLGRFIYPLLRRLVPGIEFDPLGLGILVLFLTLVFVGWAAELAIGGRIVSAWNRLLERIPVTRTIYGAVNRIVRTVLGKGAKPFNAVVLVEYPSEGLWALGFLAARAPDAMQPHVEDALSVFIPKTPNVTTGWVAVVPRSKVIFLPLTIDQGFTFLLSAGAVRLDADSPEGVPSTRPVHEPTTAS